MSVYMFRHIAEFHLRGGSRIPVEMECDSPLQALLRRPEGCVEFKIYRLRALAEGSESLLRANEPESIREYSLRGVRGRIVDLGELERIGRAETGRREELLDLQSKMRLSRAKLAFVSDERGRSRLIRRDEDVVRILEVRDL